MTEHRIRLRGGWECIPLELPHPAAYRLTLPTRWNAEVRGPLRLIRRFNQPLLDPGFEVVLRMEQVPGIRRIHLDGEESPVGTLEVSAYEISVDRSLAHHELILEVETSTPNGPEPEVSEWGVIALVIRTG
ncbi:MAG: hypothetical protein ACLQGP_41175 [Isosphaeraceae bacterium]